VVVPKYLLCSASVEIEFLMIGFNVLALIRVHYAEDKKAYVDLPE
jgi:hypothetical protein